MANYSFVVPSTYTPLTQQEIFMPMQLYKEAYEKTEEKYEDLLKKSNRFKYLSQTLPEDSTARQIYEGYAGDLQKQADDLMQHGLNLDNRAAITELKGRYSGEIGMLDEAEQALKAEQKLRREMAMKDPSMLYATDNLSIDNFLYNKTPNLYGISGNTIYARGLAAGKAASSRQYSARDAGSVLAGYYRDWVTTHGYGPKAVADFRAKAESIPELKMAIDSYMKESGIAQNLTGANYERAYEGFKNGILDGLIYEVKHEPTRDLGRMTAAEAANYNLAKQEWDYKKALLDKEKEDAEKKAKQKGGRVPAMTTAVGINYHGGYTYYTGKDDAPKLSKAKKINVTKNKDNSYSAWVYHNGNKLVLGTIDATGKYTKGSYSKKDVNDFFGSTYGWFDGWDDKYDDGNIHNMLKDALDIDSREGPTGTMNYDYFYEPDEADWQNHGGNVYRLPLSREFPTNIPGSDSDSDSDSDSSSFGIN